MMNEISPNLIWQQYQNGLDYKFNMNIPETVKQNENFYIGKQWEGVNAPDLDKPVLNILARVVSYFISMIVSDAIGVSCEFFNTMPDEEQERAMEILQAQIEQYIEDNDLNTLSKAIVRAAAIDGDVCIHNYFDAQAPTGQLAQGLLKVELIDTLDTVFGNQQVRDKEKQPYIILASRRYVDDVKREMYDRGRPDADIDMVVPDDQTIHGQEYLTNDDNMCTVLTKYYRVGDSIHVVKTTQNVIVQDETDLGYKHYPIAWMSWETVRDSYHGQAAVSELIPNQIAINKLFAMAIKYERELAFPKLLIDKTKIKEWTNRIGVVYVNGDPQSAVARFSGGESMNPQVMQLIDLLINYTRDLMGASDAALGNVRPDNTSAIIAVQQATAIPLEIQRREYKAALEDIIRSALDIITCDYGIRSVMVEDVYGDKRMELFDFASLKDAVINMKVDVGASAFWSELTQTQTLDNLFQNGIITDAVDYLEAMPDSMIPNKNRLVAQLKQKRDEMNGLSDMQDGNAALSSVGGAPDMELPEMQPIIQ